MYVLLIMDSPTHSSPQKLSLCTQGPSVICYCPHWSWAWSVTLIISPCEYPSPYDRYHYPFHMDHISDVALWSLLLFSQPLLFYELPPCWITNLLHSIKGHSLLSISRLQHLYAFILHIWYTKNAHVSSMHIMHPHLRWHLLPLYVTNGNPHRPPCINITGHITPVDLVI